FLFRCDRPELVRRNWEHTRFEWKHSDAIKELTTVPRLRDAYVSARNAARSGGLPGADDILRQVEKDAQHGAEELGLWTLDALLADLKSIQSRCEDHAEVVSEFRKTCTEALAVRPSMAPPVSAAAEAFSAVQDAESPADGQHALTEILNRREAAPLEAARRAAEHVKSDAGVVTLSYSSTVLATLHQAADRLDRLIVGESRPANEGRRTAKLAVSFGIPVTLATDAGATSLTQQADLLLLGADALQEDGSAVNKTGSTALAAAAGLFDCPCLIVTTESKVLPTGRETELEEKPPEELGESIRGVDVSNVYFERVPPRLIDTIAGENGTLSPERIRELAGWRKNLCDLLRQ
ncbi:MAG: hypothetical protein V5A84_04560, partial [Planctomycetota bacterium]